MIGQPDLINENVQSIKIVKGSTNLYDGGRAGQLPSARENLFANWGIRETDVRKAYGDENLKNTHGEQFHTDNDKVVEYNVTTAGEIDIHMEEIDNTLRSYDRISHRMILSESNDVIGALDYLEKTYGGSYDEDNDEEKKNDDPQADEIKREVINQKQRKQQLRASIDWIDDLEKAKRVTFEGQRGGDVIGHTKEGSPIYSSSHDIYTQGEQSRKKFFSSYGKNDHAKAASLHSKGSAAHNFHSMAAKSEDFEEILDLLKATKEQDGKVHRVMHEFKHGELHSGSKDGPQVTSRDQAIAIALDEAGLSKKSMDLVAALEMTDEEMAKKIMRGLHENARGIMRGRKSEIDSLIDSINKAKLETLKDNGHTNTDDVRDAINPLKTGTIATKRSMIKAIGPGGVQFEFGNITGNPIADVYNEIFQKNIEPQQAGIAQNSKEIHDKAAAEFIKKGEEKYMANYNEEQVVDTVKAEETGGGGSLIRPDSELRNQILGTKLNIGGESVQAKSETDMYVLKQHEDMFKGMEEDGGMIIDATRTGNGVVIDALSGKAYDIMTGDEVGK